MGLTEMQRKYLIRMRGNAIAHDEFTRWGKRPVLTAMSLHKRGLVECTTFDGDGVVDPLTCRDEFWWVITDTGMKALSR
jgi:hypothetical protein